MQQKATDDPWHRLVHAVVDRGTLGVIAMVLVVTLACIVAGADSTAIYALVALVAAFTVLIAVTAVLLRKKTTGKSPADQPSGQQDVDQPDGSATLDFDRRGH